MCDHQIPPACSFPPTCINICCSLQAVLLVLQIPVTPGTLTPSTPLWCGAPVVEPTLFKQRCCTCKSPASWFRCCCCLRQALLLLLFKECHHGPTPYESPQPNTNKQLTCYCYAHCNHVQDYFASETMHMAPPAAPLRSPQMARVRPKDPIYHLSWC